MIRAWTDEERNAFLPAKTNSCIIKNIDRMLQKNPVRLLLWKSTSSAASF